MISRRTLVTAGPLAVASCGRSGAILWESIPPRTPDLILRNRQRSRAVSIRRPVSEPAKAM